MVIIFKYLITFSETLSDMYKGMENKKNCEVTSA